MVQDISLFSFAYNMAGKNHRRRDLVTGYVLLTNHGANE